MLTADQAKQRRRADRGAVRDVLLEILEAVLIALVSHGLDDRERRVVGVAHLRVSGALHIHTLRPESLSEPQFVGLGDEELPADQRGFCDAAGRCKVRVDRSSSYHSEGMNG